MKVLVFLIATSNLIFLVGNGAVAEPPHGGSTIAEGTAQRSSSEVWSLEPFLGVWRAVGEDGTEANSMVEIGRDYFSVVRGGKIDHREKVLAVERGGLLVSLFGNRRHIALDLDGDELVAKHEIPRTIFDSDPEPRTVRYRRVEERPAAFDLAPRPLGDARPLPAERVAEIEAELARRGELGQQVREVFETAGHTATEEDTKRMAQVDSDNTAWLTDLVAEVGWIDSQRFSAEAAEVAFLIVQHSGDLRLMAAALPAIEADFQASGTQGGRYALLLDRFRMWRAERQRYGSQLGFGADGMFLYPLEEPETVDERRSQVGLEPLAEYLERFRERNGGKPVEMREDF